MSSSASPTSTPSGGGPTAVPLERSTGELFLEVADDLRALFGRICDELGLTPMEATTLRHAARHRHQAAIVEALELTATRVSALLGVLERKGLLTRTKARGDYRQRIVTLTAQGDVAMETLNARLERESPLLRRLDDPQRATLHALLVTLRS